MNNYRYKYFSYHEGAVCTAELNESEHQALVDRYNSLGETKSHFVNAEDFVLQFLMFNL